MTYEGKTALVTGASSGLGEEWARQLAREGCRLVLTARRMERLEALADEIKAAHGLKPVLISLDLTDPGSPLELLRRLDEERVSVDILINNAGFAQYGEFIEVDFKGNDDLIAVNIRALTSLSYHFGRRMADKGSGAIVQVASTAAWLPGPLMAVYYASKAYVLSFSAALRHELSSKGVQVMAFCPGPVATEFQERADLGKSKLMKLQFMTAPEAVSYGMRRLREGKAEAIPGLSNQIQTLLTRLAPRSVLAKMVADIQGRSH